MFRIGHYTGHIYDGTTSMCEIGECFTIVEGSVEEFGGSLEKEAAFLHGKCDACHDRCPRAKGTINITATIYVERERYNVDERPIPTNLGSASAVEEK